MATAIPSVAASAVSSASDWWEEVNESPVWQNRIFFTLASLFGLISVVALIQLIRIECRVPEYGWTTQKVFHLLNFLVNGVRSAVFAFRPNVQKIRPEILQHILLDMPALAFFTTYALLALFWAEIYYQARGVSTDALRPTFYTTNAVVYVVQILLWLLMWWKPIQVIIVLSKIFFAGASLLAALGFLLYGGRLFLMLQRFPVESKGRRKKLHEVGYVTTICFTCFLIRCIMMCFNAFDKAADIDVLDHPILNLFYYLLSSEQIQEIERSGEARVTRASAIGDWRAEQVRWWSPAGAVFKPSRYVRCCRGRAEQVHVILPQASAIATRKDIFKFQF